MELFHSKTVRILIIASATALVCAPYRCFSSEQLFDATRTLVLGPYPCMLTLQHTPSTAEKGKLILSIPGENNNNTVYWESGAEGSIQLILNMQEVYANQVIPITLSVPEQWNGRIRSLGGGHTIRGNNLKFQSLQLSITGQEAIQLTGSISQFSLHLTGEINLRSAQLEVDDFLFEGIGAGFIELTVRKKLKGYATGNFKIQYLGKASEGTSIKLTGNSFLRSLSGSSNTSVPAIAPKK